MATPDAQMNLYLSTIDTGVYGKDIKNAIHDGMEKSYNDSYNWANTAIGTANAASTKADSALSEVEKAVGDIPEIREMAEDIEESYTELTARVDNIIAHNNDTDGNSELIDIRTTYQGSVAGSAGTAVRVQAKMLNDRINNYLNNDPRSQVAVNMPAGVSYELLWENPISSDSFDAQTITFSEAVTDATGLLLVYLIDKTDSTDTTEYTEVLPLPITSGGSITKRVLDSAAERFCLRARYRDFTVQADRVVVSDCMGIRDANPFTLDGTELSIAGASSVIAEEPMCIYPLKIYAIKHVINGTLSVSKDSEIVDARLGADDTLYDTLGEAIRTQVAQYVDAAVLELINGSY